MKEHYDVQVDRALAAVGAGRLTGLGELYDLMSPAVYGLTSLITDDPAAAEDATVEAFVQVWKCCADRPADSTGARWVLDIACRCARESQQLTSAPAAPRIPRDRSWETTRTRVAN